MLGTKLLPESRHAARVPDPHQPGAPGEHGRAVVPLRRRPVDLAVLAFFFVNLFYIAYLFDIDALTDPHPTQAAHPSWPPWFVAEVARWWGRHFDPLDLARPPFFRMTVWIEVVYFGPYYIAAIYAFVRGRDWIRVPSALWAGLLISNVLLILSEEVSGPYHPPHLAIVLVAYLGWLVFPIVVVLRVLREHPFAAPVGHTTARPGGANLSSGDLGPSPSASGDELPSPVRGEGAVPPVSQ